MIVEAIITTMDEAGLVNFAPMGVEWGDDRIVVKPFLETTTFRNLRDGGAAVVNLTDDVMLFARAAISSPQYPAFPAVRVRGVVLEAACSWRELEVRHIDATPPRSRIDFNRARNAVLETAIVATRTHLISAAEIREDVARLQVIVDKTAGPREREAMALLTDYIENKLAAIASTQDATQGAGG
jgi:hypothetical protein